MPIEIGSLTSIAVLIIIVILIIVLLKFLFAVIAIGPIETVNADVGTAAAIWPNMDHLFINA